ncbi:hypothetical protein [Dongia sp.]|uniref:hypothetical protein n=1 Tax=Dongia sp. TaxID=1977262 RepID=UPI0037534FC0
MFTKQITLAAVAAALSATVLASNANAMDCASLTGNQLLAAIERGQCEVLVSGDVKTVVESDRYIRTSRGSPAGTSGKSGGGYGY